MQEFTIDVQQQIAASETPGTEFQALPWARQRVVFFLLPESIQREVLDDMDRQDLRRFVRRLDPDDATDVIGLLDGDTLEAVLSQLDADRRERIESLPKFSPASAAGMMDLDYVPSTRTKGSRKWHGSSDDTRPELSASLLSSSPMAMMCWANYLAIPWPWPATGRRTSPSIFARPPRFDTNSPTRRSSKCSGPILRVKSSSLMKTTASSESSTRTTSCRPSRRRLVRRSMSSPVSTSISAVTGVEVRP